MALRPANPQGKGITPTISAWRASQPTAVAPKNASQLLKDYYVSLLVLSARFTFKPVLGVTYYLYLKNSEWRLSLIEPECCRNFGDCLGSCELKPDMTWALVPDPDVLKTPEIQTALQGFHDQFVDWLDQDVGFAEQLPFYAEQLPFHARLAAAGLAKSMMASADTDVRNTTTRHWLEASNELPLLPGHVIPETKQV